VSPTRCPTTATAGSGREARRARWGGGGGTALERRRAAFEDSHGFNLEFPWTGAHWLLTKRAGAQDDWLRGLVGSDHKGRARDCDFGSADFEVASVCHGTAARNCYASSRYTLYGRLPSASGFGALRRILLSSQFWPIPSMSRRVIDCAKLCLSHPFSRIKWIRQWAVDRDPVLTSTTSAKIGKTAIVQSNARGM